MRMTWPGTWSFRSKSDPRWNCRGDAASMVLTAGMPKEARSALDKMKGELGYPPADLEIYQMKD